MYYHYYYQYLKQLSTLKYFVNIKQDYTIQKSQFIFFWEGDRILLFSKDA